MKILITSARWKGALTCMRSLGKAGHEISLIHYNSSHPHLYSKFCKHHIIAPHEEKREEYVNFLIDHIKNNQYDVLIPASEVCAGYISQYRDEINKHVHTILPPQESFNIASNKGKTYQFALDNDIPIPKTFFINSLNDLKEVADQVSYPCIIKYPVGWSGNANYYMRNKDKLLSFSETMDTSSWPVIQELVHGKSCGFTAACHNGHIVDYFMWERLRQYPESKGVSVYAKTIFDEKALDYCDRMIKKLSWNGPIGFDYIKTDDDNIYFLEINPRLSGITQFAYNLGVDISRTCFDALDVVKEEDLSIKYKVDQYYRAVFSEEILSCVENKSYWKDFFRNFFKLKHTYDFSLTDLKLLWWQLKYGYWSLKGKEILKGS